MRPSAARGARMPLKLHLVLRSLYRFRGSHFRPVLDAHREARGNGAVVKVHTGLTSGTGRGMSDSKENERLVVPESSLLFQSIHAVAALTNNHIRSVGSHLVCPARSVAVLNGPSVHGGGRPHNAPPGPAGPRDRQSPITVGSAADAPCCPQRVRQAPLAVPQGARRPPSRQPARHRALRAAYLGCMPLLTSRSSCSLTSAR